MMIERRYCYPVVIIIIGWLLWSSLKTLLLLENRWLILILILLLLSWAGWFLFCSCFSDFVVKFVSFCGFDWEMDDLVDGFGFPRIDGLLGCVWTWFLKVHVVKLCPFSSDVNFIIFCFLKNQYFGWWVLVCLDFWFGYLYWWTMMMLMRMAFCIKVVSFSAIYWSYFVMVLFKVTMVDEFCVFGLLRDEFSMFQYWRLCIWCYTLMIVWLDVTTAYMDDELFLVLCLLLFFCICVELGILWSWLCW